jgi:hypothetical protein
MYDNKYQNILSRSKIVEEKLHSIVFNYAINLRGNSSYRFIANKLNIAEIFGSIKTFKYDSDLLKVTFQIYSKDRSISMNYFPTL